MLYLINNKQDMTELNFGAGFQFGKPAAKKKTADKEEPRPERPEGLREGGFEYFQAPVKTYDYTMEGPMSWHRANHALDALAAIGGVPAGGRIDAILHGDFVFGDFVYGFIQKFCGTVTRLRIATYSINDEQVLSLIDMVATGKVLHCDLHVGYAFASYQRQDEMKLIGEAIAANNLQDRFKICVFRNHMKEALLTTDNGLMYAFSGSANMRKSDSIEKFTLEENPDYVIKMARFLDPLLEKYNIVKASSTALTATVTAPNVWPIAIAASKPAPRYVCRPLRKAAPRPSYDCWRYRRDEIRQRREGRAETMRRAFFNDEPAYFHRRDVMNRSHKKLPARFFEWDPINRQFLS